MASHDPSEYIRGIQQILISDKKKIGFLFGAGTSLAKKSETSLTVPAIGKMTKEIIEKLVEKSEIKKALEEIKEELTEKNFNIETILSLLEQKAAFIGLGTLNGLKKDDFKGLIANIKKNIKEKVSVHLINEKIASKKNR